MINQVAQLLNRASIFVRPEDVLLQKGAWVRFSDKWQGNFGQDIAGKLYLINDHPVLVEYPLSRIIPGNDFIDIDLSSQTMPQPPATVGTQQLYPMRPGVLYQIIVGFKKGHYFVPIYIPGGTPIFGLGSSYLQSPLFTAADGRRYLGAKTYKDSPEESPLLSFFAIQNMPSIVMRLYADTGVDFEKVVVTFSINKCKMVIVTNPTEVQKNSALELPFYTEYKDF